jgi:hypothetical protein
MARQRSQLAEPDLIDAGAGDTIMRSSGTRSVACGKEAMTRRKGGAHA